MGENLLSNNLPFSKLCIKSQSIISETLLLCMVFIQLGIVPDRV